MSKIIKPFVITLSLFLLGISAIGCAAQDGLTELTRIVDQGVETADTFDEVEEQDLSESGIGSLGTILPLSFNQVEDELTPAEKIALIRQIRADIRTTHEAVVAERSAFKIAVSDLRIAIEAFRASGDTLSDAEKTALTEWKIELRGINTTLRDTIGKAYRQMADLRGSYSLANVDHILSVHQEVLAVVESRLTNIERANVILGEIIAMLEQEAE